MLAKIVYVVTQSYFFTYFETINNTLNFTYFNVRFKVENNIYDTVKAFRL